MSKFRLVLSEQLRLNRYYRPVLIDISLLRAFIPNLPTNEQDVTAHLQAHSDEVLEFLAWYHSDSGDHVTDPKGKGQDWPESQSLADASLVERGDTSWMWLFNNFSNIDESVIKQFCQEHGYPYEAPPSLEQRMLEFEASLHAADTILPEHRSLVRELLSAEDANEVDATLELVERHVKTASYLVDLLGCSDASSLKSLTGSFPYWKNRSRIVVWLLGQLARKEVEWLLELTVLDLRQHDLSHLSDWIGLLDKLQDVNLSSTNLSELPPEIGHLSQLQTLNIQDTEVTALPPEVLTFFEEVNVTPEGRMRPSSTLKLWCNDDILYQINCHLLERLCQRAHNDAQFAAQIERLNLSGYHFQHLPPQIEALDDLTELNLSQNKLTELPDAINHMASLEQLDIQGNPLVSFPDSFSASVSFIKFDKFHWQTFQNQICALTRLKRLHLTDMRLSLLPEQLTQLKSLEELNVSGNRLTQLPNWLGQLTTLKKLVLRQNQLTAVPSEMGQLTELTFLDLTQNKLTELPSEMGQLESLQMFRLRENQLKTLPDEFSRLTNLSLLDMRRNALAVLPAWIQDFTQLSVLSLYSNRLEVIPDWVEELESLEVLDIRDNPLIWSKFRPIYLRLRNKLKRLQS